MCLKVPDRKKIKFLPIYPNLRKPGCVSPVDNKSDVKIYYLLSVFMHILQLYGMGLGDIKLFFALWFHKRLA